MNNMKKGFIFLIGLVVLISTLASSFASAQMSQVGNSFYVDLKHQNQFITGGSKPFEYTVAESLNRIYTLFNEDKKYFSSVYFSFDPTLILQNSHVSGTPAAAVVLGPHCTYYFDRNFQSNSFIFRVKSKTGMDSDDVLTWIAAHETFHCISETDLSRFSAQGLADSLIIRLSGVTWNSYNTPTQREQISFRALNNERLGLLAGDEKYWQESVSDVAGLIILQIMNQKYGRPLLSEESILSLANFRNGSFTAASHQTGNSIKMYIQMINNRLIRLDRIKSLEDVAQTAYQVCLQAIRFNND